MMLKKWLHRATTSQFVGGILLISGTTIGAGMLALPISTGAVGFGPSLIVFFLCWLFMLATAYFFLDVNLATPGDINLISMAHKTLGKWGQVLSWAFYLLLLYSLVAAYIAASAPLFQAAIYAMTGIKLSHQVTFFALPLLFGSFVYLGTRGVDRVNRILMIGLILSYLILVVLVPSHVNLSFLTRVSWTPILATLPVVITSFGYHIIIPSLTNYMSHDRKRLRLTILIGSIIPLVVYILWQFLVLGAVPYEGEYGLAQAWKKGMSSTAPLAHFIQSSWLIKGSAFFAFFAIVTSFLGVSLSLSDFLIDGLKIKKGWEGRLLALVMVFLPPLLFVFISPRGFIAALEYAGACVAILLGFLPAAMAWTLPKYKSFKHKALLILVMNIALFIAIISLFVAK